MTSEPSPARTPRPLPADYQLDTRTAYIYDHFAHLLTDDERAAQRVRHGQLKQWAYDPGGTEHLDHWLHEVKGTFPELLRRIDERGVGRVMREAAERVLRDNAGVKILHTCPKCGELCRTPAARQCLTCGFDWHPKEGE